MVYQTNMLCEQHFVSYVGGLLRTFYGLHVVVVADIYYCRLLLEKPNLHTNLLHVLSWNLISSVLYVSEKHITVRDCRMGMAMFQLCVHCLNMLCQMLFNEQPVYIIGV